jgi:hypothetical protein
LAQQVDSISHVQVQPKYGQAENELTKFRYDAILHVGHPAHFTESERDVRGHPARCTETERDVRGHTVALQSEIVWHDWRKLEPNLRAIERLLESDVPRLRTSQTAVSEPGDTAQVAEEASQQQQWQTIGRLGQQPELEFL